MDTSTIIALIVKRLRHEISEKEERAFQLWIKAEPSNAALYKKLKEEYENKNACQEYREFESLKDWNRLIGKIKKKRKIRYAGIVADIDIFDIERVDVLKDASATVLYGERASNGVILIERTRIKEAKARVKYNFVPNFSFPDLRSLRLCNAEEKLELERIAGLYNTVDGSLDPAYALKLENVRRGVNTDWPSKPLRTAFTHTHSIHITGKGGGLDYKASGRFSDIYGVMKGDYRKVYGTNFKLGYHPSKSLTLNYNFSFSMTENKLSPYGRFSQYTKLNPYENIYDAEGKFIKNFYFNPLKKDIAVR